MWPRGLWPTGANTTDEINPKQNVWGIRFAKGILPRCSEMMWLGHVRISKFLRVPKVETGKNR